MSNTYNQHYNLGRRGYTDGTAASAEGYKKYQQERAERERKNREWEEMEYRRGQAALNRPTPKSSRSKAASTPKKSQEDGYFSRFGAILGFVLAFGNAMNTPEADPIVSGIIGLIAAAILGKTFKYLLWIGGVIVLLILFFGGENGGN